MSTLHVFISLFLSAWVLCRPPNSGAAFHEGADPAALLAQADQVDLERYPDADSVYLFSGERTRFAPDGTSVSHRESWVKILTEKGRREQSVISFRYNEAYDEVDIHRAEIHRADGTVHVLDIEALSRVMIDPAQTSQNIYDPKQKILRMGIPGLERGDLIRLHTEYRQVKPRMADTWSDLAVLEAPVPLVHAVYEIEAPPQRPLLIRKLRGEVPGTVVYEQEVMPAGAVLHRWVARDVPRLFPEPGMPDWWTVSQRVLVSTIPDWETVSRWYWNLSLPRLGAVTPAMEEKVRELTAGLSGRQERIEALFQFVSQQIRYMGLTMEDEAPGYEPHDVSITFENRYGVCRDKAALLVAMLRLDGIEAFPTLLHSGPRKDPEVPQPYFNHAIVAVRELDGGYQLMDMTDETTRDLLPAYLGNCSYLVATPEGETLHTSPVVPARENMVRIQTEAVLFPAGDLQATSRVVFEGINDNAYRGYFATVKPEERRRFFEGQLKRNFPGAVLLAFSLDPENMQDIRHPLEAHLDFLVPDYPVQNREAVILPPPWVGTSMGMIHFVFRDTGLHTRRFPLRTQYACGIEETFSLTFMDRSLLETPALPAPPPIEEAALSWSQSLVVQGDRMEGAALFQVHTPEISPEEYPALKAMLGDMEYNRRVWPVFPLADAPAPEPAGSADVSVAFRRTEIFMEPGGTWSSEHHLRKTVLTYAGVKDHAEVILPYNPAWDEVELVWARVTDPDGTVRDAQDEEINLMDADWVAGAPRYPAGKNMVINLPGVRVGSTLDILFRRRSNRRPFFDYREPFGGTEPAEWMELVLDTPVSVLPVLLITGGSHGITYTEETTAEGRLRRKWTHPHPMHAYREDHLPPDWILYPTLLASTGHWPSYAATVFEHLHAAAQHAEEARRTAQTLTAGLNDERSRVQALRDFVARRIRHAGPAFPQLPLDALTPADHTLRDGYGNNADRAILLYALLESAGFTPTFVLASSLPADPDMTAPLVQLPQSDLFSSVLVRVVSHGDTWHLNDTDQYAELGTTRHDGNLALALPEGYIETIRATEGQAERTRTAYHIRIGHEGEAHIDVRHTFSGPSHAAMRKRFEEMTPEDRRRYHQEIVSAVSHRAHPDGPLSTQFSSYPGEINFSVDIDRFAVVEGARMYVHLPGWVSGPNVRSDRRTHPVWWTERSTHETVQRIEPPAGSRPVAVPPALHWTAPGRVAALSQTLHVSVHDCTQEPEAWTVTTHSEQRPGLIDSMFYPELLHARQRIHHPRNRLFLFERPAQEDSRSTVGTEEERAPFHAPRLTEPPYP